MTETVALLRRLYDRFNARDIESVLTSLSDDVIWANAMEGGHVEGRSAVRAYWTRQMSAVRVRVEPTGFQSLGEDTFAVAVEQAILEGDDEAREGLADQSVRHVFKFRDGLIARFDIENG